MSKEEHAEPIPSNYVIIGREATHALNPQREEPEAGLMRAVVVGLEEQKFSSNLEQFHFLTTEVGGTRYASMAAKTEFLVPAGSAAEKPEQPDGDGFWLVKYEVDGDRLTLWVCDIDAVVKLVETGELAGEVKRGRLKSVALTGTPEELRNYLANGGDAKIFPKQKNRVEYERLK